MDLSRPYSVVVNSGKPVARMVLVRNGSVSQSFNSDQRFLELDFAAAATPGSYAVHAPSSAAGFSKSNNCFCINENGGIGNRISNRI
jgi:cytochrome c oxidase assembly protein Cox11